MRNLLRRLKFWASLRGKAEQTNDHDSAIQKEFGADLERNLEKIRTLLGNSTDLVIREFNFGSQGQVQAALVFVDGLVNKSLINESIVKPLLYDTRLIEHQALQENDLDFIQRSLLAVGDVDKKTGFDELISSLLFGNVIFLLDGSDSFLVIDAKGWQTRAIEEPKVEQTVRGPRRALQRQDRKSVV